MISTLSYIFMYVGFSSRAFAVKLCKHTCKYMHKCKRANACKYVHASLRKYTHCTDAHPYLFAMMSVQPFIASRFDLFYIFFFIYSLLFFDTKRNPRRRGERQKGKKPLRGCDVCARGESLIPTRGYIKPGAHYTYLARG